MCTMSPQRNCWTYIIQMFKNISTANQVLNSADRQVHKFDGHKITLSNVLYNMLCSLMHRTEMSVDLLNASLH